MSTLPLPVLQPKSQGGAGSDIWSRITTLLRSRAKARSTYAVADQVVYSFGNMVVAALMSRHCAPQQFGIYILTQRTMDVLIQLSNVFLWAPFTFNLPGTPTTRKAGYQGSTLGLQLVLCVLFSLLLGAATCLPVVSSRAEFYGTFAPLVWAGSGILFREFTRRMYFAHLRLAEAFWTDLATVTLQIAGVYLLYRAHHLDVSHTLYVLCAGSVAVSLWWIFKEWPGWQFRLEDAHGDMRNNLRLGRWFLGSNMIFMVTSQCNPWVLSGVMGSSAVGAYSVCESVVNIPRVALTSMQNIMAPMVARAHNDGGRAGVRSVVRRLDRALLLGSIVFAVAIWGVGPLVARLIFRTVPGDVRTVLVLLALNLIAYAATLAQSYGLTALGRADTTLYANRLGLLAQAAACVLLVRSFHIPGAAAAMLIGSLLTLCAREYFF